MSLNPLTRPARGILATAPEASPPQRRGRLTRRFAICLVHLATGLRREGVPPSLPTTRESGVDPRVRSEVEASSDSRI